MSVLLVISNDYPLTFILSEVTTCVEWCQTFGQRIILHWLINSSQWEQAFGIVMKALLETSIHTSYQRPWVQVPAPLVINIHPGRKEVLAQVDEFLPPSQKIQNEFLVPGFIWYHPSCCNYLENKSVDRRQLTLSPLLTSNNRLLYLHKQSRM